MGQDAGAATAAEVAPREPGRPDRQHDDKLFFFELQERGTLNDFERAQVRRMRTAAASPLQRAAQIGAELFFMLAQVHRLCNEMTNNLRPET